jgi:acetylglutamate kinase
MEAERLFDDIDHFRDKYEGTIGVIKFGGTGISNRQSLIHKLKDIAYIRERYGVKVILVNGGKEFIDQGLEKEGIEPEFDPKTGKRITDIKVLRVADKELRMVTGDVVAEYNKIARQSIAAGFSGYDGKLVTAESTNGLVGKPVQLNGDFLHAQLNAGIVPIIGPVCWDKDTMNDSRRLNVNADDLAEFIAIEMGAKKLILATDTDGVLDAQGQTIAQITPEMANELIAKEIIRGGMIPKVFSALAVANRLGEGCSVTILNGNGAYAIRKEYSTEQGSGTTFLASSYEM